MYEVPGGLGHGKTLITLFIPVIYGATVTIDFLQFVCLLQRGITMCGRYEQSGQSSRACSLLLTVGNQVGTQRDSNSGYLCEFFSSRLLIVFEKKILLTRKWEQKMKNMPESVDGIISINCIGRETIFFLLLRKNK